MMTWLGFLFQMSHLCTQPPPFYVFWREATGLQTWVELLEQLKDRTIGERLKTAQMEPSRTAQGLNNQSIPEGGAVRLHDWDIGMRLRNKSRITSALQDAYRNRAMTT
jgi:hypothetical protein